MSLKLDPGADGYGHRMSVWLDFSGSEATYEATRKDGILRVTGGPDGSMEKEYEIDDNEYLGSTFIATDIPLARQLMKLAIGESGEIQVATIQFFPSYTLYQSPWSYTRVADVEYETRMGETVTARAMAVENSGPVDSTAPSCATRTGTSCGTS